MKRISSSDSLGALMSICPTTDEQSPTNKRMYKREYESIVDGYEEEEYGHVAEKKRRLSVDQVKALERNFEVENKLEPERKVKLAQELGLQPRQVAVWFQNRRARWKTKQLERDYGLLKSNFDALQHNYESLKLDNEALLKEIKELKSKLNEEEDPDINIPIKGEAIISESDQTKQQFTTVGSQDMTLNMQNSNSSLKLDGPSDSDSSAILNEDQSPNASNSSSHHLLTPTSFRFNSSSPPSINCFSFSDSRSDGLDNTHNNVYHPQLIKMEEHNFFGGEESCNFFSEEQAPTLHWYSADQWS